MDDHLTTIRTSLQETLDEILSSRTSSTARTYALKRLERRLTDYVQHDTDSTRLDVFLALQHTFECNIPSRLVPWIAEATQKLEDLVERGEDRHAESIIKISAQLVIALSLIQGIGMLHPPSKEFLGRKFSLEIMIDLLLVSRYLPGTDLGVGKVAEELPLTSIVLDALLCVLVDSPTALRVLEDSNGVQAVVKILKRAGTPREVRMKCLEFLYFYLLDETPITPSVESYSRESTPRLPSILIPTQSVPSTPMRAPSKKPYLNGAPHHPTSRQGSSSSTSTTSTLFSNNRVSPRSASSSSTSSNSSGSTAPSSVESSPKKSGYTGLPNSPPTSPRSTSQSQPRTALRMLRKEVEFVPQSPQKVSTGRSNSRNVPSKLGAAFELESPKASVLPKTRTIEEKKEILGTMLGNVDALVEGVRKAGIWGLAN